MGERDAVGSATVRFLLNMPIHFFFWIFVSYLNSSSNSPHSDFSPSTMNGEGSVGKPWMQNGSESPTVSVWVSQKLCPSEKDRVMRALSMFSKELVLWLDLLFLGSLDLGQGMLLRT